MQTEIDLYSLASLISARGQVLHRRPDREPDRTARCPRVSIPSEAAEILQQDGGGSNACSVLRFTNCQPAGPGAAELCVQRSSCEAAAVPCRQVASSAAPCVAAPHSSDTAAGRLRSPRCLSSHAVIDRSVSVPCRPCSFLPRYPNGLNCCGQAQVTRMGLFGLGVPELAVIGVVTALAFGACFPVSTSCRFCDRVNSRQVAL